MAQQGRKNPTGIIFHSDRGSQYGSKKVRDHLKISGFYQIMSSTGNCSMRTASQCHFRNIFCELKKRINSSLRFFHQKGGSDSDFSVH